MRLAIAFMGIAFGFLSGIAFDQRFLAPPPVVYRTPTIRVEPAAMVTPDCVEQARICYARKRSAAIR